MQTIIQHVMRGYGPPTVAPVEFGIHYIDVTSGDMYLSRGKTDVADWGEPLKAAMLDGEEGKTFGWNDGQTWYMLDVGVQKELIDQKDLDVGGLLDAYADGEVIRIDPTRVDIATASDVTTISQLQTYTTDQLKFVIGAPTGGGAGVVLAKLSDADRDAHWLAVSEGEVMQADVASKTQTLLSDSDLAIDVVSDVPTGGSLSNVLVNNSWANTQRQINKPVFIFPTQSGVTSTHITTEVTPFDNVYNNAQRLHREFSINGQSILVDGDNIDLTLAPGTQHTLKCRDVTSIGVSDWGEVTFSTNNVTIGVQLDVQRTTGSLISSTPILSATTTAIGTIESFTQIVWTVLDIQSNVVWELTEPYVSGIAQTRVPKGFLTAGNEYTFSAKVTHQLAGVTSTQLTCLVAEDITRYLAFSSRDSHVYGQSIDSFSKDDINYTPPSTSTYVTTISSTGKFLVVGMSLSPYIAVYERNVSTFNRIEPAVTPSSAVYTVSFDSTDKLMCIGLDSSPYFEVYSITDGTFTKLPSPTQPPSNTVTSCCFNHTGSHIALTHMNSPALSVYAIYSGRVQKLSVTVSPGPGSGTGCSYSSQGSLLAVTITNFPYLIVYSVSGDSYKRLTNPDVIGGQTSCGSFSTSSGHMAVGTQTSPYFAIYKSPTFGMYSKVPDPAIMPAGNVKGCSFSSDDAYLAVAHTTSPYITIYKRSGDTFTKLSNPTTLPSGSATGCSFKGSSFLAVSHANSPYITIYSRNGDTFTKLTNPAALPSSDANGCSFSGLSNHLAVATQSSPYVTIYSFSGTTFTKLTNPTTLPTGSSYSCSFDSMGKYLAVAHATSPYITVYSRSGDTFTKLANPSTLPTGTAVSCAFENGFLAVVGSTSPYRRLYKLNTSMNTLTSISPGGSSPGACISVFMTQNASVMCYSQPAANGSLVMVSRVGSTDNYIQIEYPGYSPTAIANGCHFNPVTDDLVVCGDGSTSQLTIYNRVGNVLSRTLTHGEYNNNLRGCRFSPDGKYLVVVTTNTPFVIVYKWENNSLTRLPAPTPSVTTSDSSQTVPSWYYLYN